MIQNDKSNIRQWHSLLLEKKVFTFITVYNTLALFCPIICCCLYVSYSDFFSSRLKDLILWCLSLSFWLYIPCFSLMLLKNAGYRITTKNSIIKVTTLYGLLIFTFPIAFSGVLIVYCGLYCSIFIGIYILLGWIYIYTTTEFEDDKSQSNE